MVKSSKKIFHGNQVEIYSEKQNNTYPYVVRATTNNGMRGYIKAKSEDLNKGNTLTFAQDTFTVFYQKENFVTGNKVKILEPKFENLTNINSQFILASINNSIRNLSWGTGSDVNMIENIKFKLPINGDKIDFNFINNFVAELEAQRVADLEGYLSTTGLKNYNLTEDEIKILDSYDKLKFAEFDITEIFDIKNTGNILSRDIEENSGTTPYLCASSENNAVSSYIKYNEKYLDKGNCIFIGGKTFVVSYQEKDFYSNDSHNLVLYLKNEARTKLKQFYLATCVNKSLGHKYSWGDSISKAKIKKDKILLPIKDGKPYFEIMEIFISAIQKLVIKDVVDYTNEKIEITKKVINDN